MLDYLKERTELVEVLNTYTVATGVSSKAFSIDGEKFYFTRGSRNRSSFCETVQCQDHGLKKCRQSYVYGGLQCEKLGEPYIYFCPYGLVNWAVPIFSGDKMACFITGGPVLMHQVDDLLIMEIINQNPLLKTMKDEIKDQLKGIEVVEPKRVKYLADSLFMLAKGLMSQEITELVKRREINKINERISEKITALKEDYPSSFQEDNEKLYLFEKEKELVSKVKLGDKKGAREVLDDLIGFSYFQSASRFELVKLKAIELTVVLARAVIEEGADLEVIFGLEYMHLGYLKVASDINELNLCLTKVLDAFVECPFSLKNVKNRDVIFRAMNFIRNNFNKGIALEDVSNEVGLNASYFSKLFKNETGESYTDYLNRVRVEGSKQLLSQSNFSLVDIAQLVGFNDQSYFTKMFKKVEGVSPGKFRKISPKNQRFY